jgi:hypothetical protein
MTVAILPHGNTVQCIVIPNIGQYFPALPVLQQAEPLQDFVIWQSFNGKPIDPFALTSPQ